MPTRGINISSSKNQLKTDIKLNIKIKSRTEKILLFSPNDEGEELLACAEVALIDRYVPVIL